MRMSHSKEAVHLALDTLRKNKLRSGASSAGHSNPGEDKASEIHRIHRYQ